MARQGVSLTFDWVKYPGGYAPATLLVLRLPAGHTPSEAVVLTEWKIVRDTSEREQKAKDALKQARIYAGSLLGGIELRQYRYLVLVSENRLQEIEDIQEGDIVYRHINIPVNPKPPSRAARARTKRTK